MAMIQQLRAVIQDNDTPAGKAFDLFIQFLILVSIATFSIETLPDLEDSTRHFLRWAEVGTVIIFTLEYLARTFVAESKVKFVFSFFGLIDLFAILPFYIAIGIDLRSLRIFRLLRLARAFKFFRYGNAVTRFKEAFSDIRAELILFFTITLFTIYISAVGIYYFENPVQPDKFSSIFDSLWWAVATLTTVGYGDVYPVTVGGRIFTFFILMIGLGIVAVPAGLLASALSRNKV
ncbi:MAG: ion transporter [Desulfuromonadales bacterium]|nr:ion transporter [Desulfuromonadales bacterium]